MVRRKCISKAVNYVPFRIRGRWFLAPGDKRHSSWRHVDLSVPPFFPCPSGNSSGSECLLLYIWMMHRSQLEGAYPATYCAGVYSSPYALLHNPLLRNLEPSFFRCDAGGLNYLKINQTNKLCSLTVSMNNILIKTIRKYIAYSHTFIRNKSRILIKQASNNKHVCILAERGECVQD